MNMIEIERELRLSGIAETVADTALGCGQIRIAWRCGR
jgi:hypothetical protein